MADFFTRVAERTLGLTPAVKPDLPSVFTPASPVETISRPFKAAPQISPADPSPRRSSDESVAFQSAAARRNSAASPVEPTNEPNEPEVIESMFTTPSIPARQLPQDLPIPSMPDDPELASHEAPAFETIKHTIATQPATFVTSNPQTFVDNSHAPAPTIQVTIGRVEVRANVQPPSSRKTPAKKQSSHLSLDQYLRERNGGRR
jgi:hypothetical protein